jgi:hypothetical protein
MSWVEKPITGKLTHIHCRSLLQENCRGRASGITVITDQGKPTVTISVIMAVIGMAKDTDAVMYLRSRHNARDIICLSFLCYVLLFWAGPLLPLDYIPFKLAVHITLLFVTNKNRGTRQSFSLKLAVHINPPLRYITANENHLFVYILEAFH